MREELATALLREGELLVRNREKQVLLFRQDYRGRIIFVALRPVVREAKGGVQELGVVYDTKDCKGIFRSDRSYDRAWTMLESMLWYGPVELITESFQEYMGRQKDDL